MLPASKGRFQPGDAGRGGTTAPRSPRRASSLLLLSLELRPEKLGGGSRQEFCPGAGRAVETRLHPQRIPGSTFPGPWCSFLGHTAFPAHPEPPVLLLSREDGGSRLWNPAPKLSGGEGKVSHPREQGRARGVPVSLWSPALSHLVVPQKRRSGHRHLPPPKTGRKGQSKGKYSWQRGSREKVRQWLWEGLSRDLGSLRDWDSSPTPCGSLLTPRLDNDLP